jgi:single-strand DNA-binding protein
MNKLIINGNITKEVELKFMEGTGLAVLTNTVAARRKFKDKKTDKYESDFIPFKAFGKSAEFIAEHFTKGQGIMLECRMQSGSYDNKEGKKVYTLEAIVENVEFVGGKKEGNSNNEYSAPQNNNFDDMTPVDDSDSDMPF